MEKKQEACVEKKTVGRVRAKLTAGGEIVIVGVRAGRAISKEDAKELLHTLDYSIRKQAGIVPDWEERLRHSMV